MFIEKKIHRTSFTGINIVFCLKTTVLQDKLKKHILLMIIETNKNEKYYQYVLT